MKKKDFLSALPHVQPLSIEVGDFGGLESEDVEGSLRTGNGVELSHRLFGFLTPERILADLSHSGVEGELSERGYRKLDLEIARVDSFQESLRLWGEHRQGRDYLVDLRAHWGQMSFPSSLGTSRFVKALVWDWVELRDPFGVFARPPLPGQSKPGLRLFQRFVKQMRDYVAETDAECLVAVPQYFHNAVFYCRSKEFAFVFLDPARQGEFVAQQRDLLLGKLSRLSDVSWAFERGQVEVQQISGQGPCESSSWQPYLWRPAELVLPLRSDLVEMMLTEERLRQVEQHSSPQFRWASTDPPNSPTPS